MNDNRNRNLITDPDPTCEICGSVYEGWWVDTSWKLLPPELLNCFLCCSCYLKERKQ